ncbi:MAG: helix-turn-helix domain-containing protein [Deltaproteobacteria bacterium]|nr:helix-turn-helix domain-containing protein [Deltaproteobacteria bacterium]
MGRWWNPETEIPIPVAARILRCTPRWVHELIRRGDLDPGHKYSPRKTTVSRESVEARLEKYAFPSL